MDPGALAFDRAFLSRERALMDWIRTATSLITFGFALYQAFFYLRDLDPERMADQVVGPRSYAIIIIAVGILALAFATVQHHLAVRAMRRQNPSTPRSIATVVAGLIVALGVFAFVVAVLRV